MAKMIPPSFPEERKDLGAERVVFHALRKQLGDDFTVLWSISTFDLDVRQIDFLVLHPKLGVVVIEVKGGQVSLGNPMDPHRKWSGTTRAKRPIKIENPFQQAQGAGMAFIRDLKANTSFSPYIAITPLVILPHTPQPPDADVVLDRKAEYFLFEGDLELVRRRVLMLMEKAMYSGDRYDSPEAEGVASIVELYGRQHTLPPEPAEDELPQELAEAAMPPASPPPSWRQIGPRIAGLALAAGALIVLAVSYGPRLFPAAPPPVSPVVAVKPAAPKPVVPQLPAGQKAPQTHTGTPEVLDTATLGLDVRRLPLAGLQAVHMPEAVSAARDYLAQAGEVACELSAVGGWRCISMAKGLDIAEVFALSGFAKASANAPELIRNAEDMARQNGKGVWRPS